MYKLRTMVENNEPGFTQENDKRVTKVGKILRRTHIDELPQVVNVLKGEDATKAYGEKGKYGVVEITTKDAARKGNGIIINTGFEAQKILLLGKSKEKC